MEGDNIIYKAEERMAEWREKSKGVRDALGLLLHQQILAEVEERVPLEDVYKKNKTLWGKVLLRSKPF